MGPGVRPASSPKPAATHQYRGSFGGYSGGRERPKPGLGGLEKCQKPATPRSRPPAAPGARRRSTSRPLPTPSPESCQGLDGTNSLLPGRDRFDSRATSRQPPSTDGGREAPGLVDGGGKASRPRLASRFTPPPEPLRAASAAASRPSAAASRRPGGCPAAVALRTTRSRQSSRPTEQPSRSVDSASALVGSGPHQLSPSPPLAPRAAPIRPLEPLHRRRADAQVTPAHRGRWMAHRSAPPAHG